MDHQEASSGHAVERYLLGEMAEPELESFEQHFFECAVCTEELASGALLEENVRAVSETWTPAPKPGILNSFALWLRQPWFAAPAFAAVALAFVTVYQAREIARIHQPHPLLAYNLKPESRGEPNRILADKPNISINVDLADNSFSEYRCVLSDAAGHRIFSVETEAPPAGELLRIEVPLGLEPGNYILTVQGVRGSPTGAEATYRVEAVKQ